MTRTRRSNEHADHPLGLLKRIFLGDLPLEAETSFFILVNVIDFFVTYWMLAVGGFRESNPVAAYFLHRWGPVKGMLIFKLSLVTFVILVSQLIALKRPETARRLLIFGSLAVAGVVVYSLMLYSRHG